MIIIEDVKETPGAKTTGGGALDDDEVWGDVEDVSLHFNSNTIRYHILLTKK